jgi:hypothetical protein
MRAQYVPELAGHTWSARVTVPVCVDVTWAARAALRIAHGVQDAGTSRLQHIDNNHLNAIAKDPRAMGPPHPREPAAQWRS